MTGLLFWIAETSMLNAREVDGLLCAGASATELLLAVVGSEDY